MDVDQNDTKDFQVGTVKELQEAIQALEQWRQQDFSQYVPSQVVSISQNIDIETYRLLIAQSGQNRIKEHLQ